MLSRIHLISLTLLFAALILVGGCTLGEQSTVAQPVEQVSTPAPNITCDQLVTLAETSVGLVCEGLGRNEACYGNHLVSVGFKPNSNLTFVQAGDKVDLLQIQRLSTSPLNMQTHDWGIAVIKAQANLPDALPGQNVTFLLYGDTTLDNPSPNMQAVTISTRIGQTSCTQAPDSAVLIQSPSGSNVAMNINGADVTLGSTAYVTADTDSKRMMFAVLEGEGVISAQGITQTVLPGMKTGIPLGGADGLHADGPPSVPEPYDITTIGLAPIKLLDRPIVIPPPGQGTGIIPVSSPVSAASPAPQATACAPRTDWTYRYVVQRGDFLSSIAQRVNMRTSDLQTGNCITDPNRLIAGQSLHVPFPVPTNTPPPPTATPTSVAPTGPNLRADKNPIGYGDCTTVRWDIDNISQVYFEGQPVIGHDSRQVCPQETTTYTLLAVLLDGTRMPYQITITLQSVCGNNVCEPDENTESCSADCYIIQ